MNAKRRLIEACTSTFDFTAAVDGERGERATPMPPCHLPSNLPQPTIHRAPTKWHRGL